jgi:hypothetical protein
MHDCRCTSILVDTCPEVPFLAAGNIATCRCVDDDVATFLRRTALDVVDCCSNGVYQDVGELDGLET